MHIFCPKDSRTWEQIQIKALAPLFSDKESVSWYSTLQIIIGQIQIGEVLQATQLSWDEAQQIVLLKV